MLDPVTILLATGRLGGMAFTAPVLSNPAVGRSVRVLISAALAVGFMWGRGGVVEASSFIDLATLTGVEFAIGAAMGLMTRLMFVGVELAAEQASVQMGISLGQVYSGGPDSAGPIGSLFGMVAILVFIAIGGLNDLVWALGESLNMLPVGAWLDGSEQHVLSMIVAGLSGAFVLALKIAGGVLAAMLLTSAALGVAQRMIPQAHILSTGLPARALVGLGACAGALKAMGWAIEEYWTPLGSLLATLWKGV